MRYLIPIILMVPALASAQPRPTCDVTIVRAPDDVRPVVQHWIDAEPRCRGSLEVRIIPTDGGYYLIARDERGHTNERVVPDAQSAGVLIASWAADDRPPPSAPIPMGATPAPTIAPTAAPMAATPGPMAPTSGPSLTAPGATPLYGPSPVVDGGLARTEVSPRWLTIGATLSPQVVGARLEMDLKRGRWWAIGVSGSVTNGEDSNAVLNGKLTIFDAMGLVHASAVLESGNFELRGSVGVGMGYTKVDVLYNNPTNDYGGDGVYGIADMSILLGYRVGPNWGLAAGPVLSIFNQSFDLSSSTPSSPMTFRRAADLAFFIAVRHQL